MVFSVSVLAIAIVTVTTNLISTPKYKTLKKIQTTKTKHKTMA